MKLSVNQYLFRIVFTPIAVLSVMLALSLLSIRVQSSLSNSVLESREIESTAQNILLNFLNMETGLRGYIASRDPVFLEPYWPGEQMIRQALLKLETLSHNDAQHVKNIGELRILLGQWMNYSEGVRKKIETAPVYSRPPAAFTNHEGRKIMDQIRKSVEEIASHESSLYAVRSSQVNESVRISIYSIFALGLILGAFVVFHLIKEILRLGKDFTKNLEETALAKQALETVNAGLEETIQTRTHELRSANAELEAFCYSVSHDLRAPLRGIDGFSEALQEEYGKVLPEQGNVYLGHVRSGVQKMGRLIDDLLALSRLSRTETSFEEFDLAGLASEIEGDLQNQNPNRVVEFNSTPHALVRADKGLMRSVLTNLLSNAWKFTEKVPSAQIAFGITERHGKKVFFVKDNGAGFDMSHYGKLFGAFQRLHSAKEFPGTGVGLATVKRIIRRHGGEVWAESQVGMGATFFFSLET